MRLVEHAVLLPPGYFLCRHCGEVYEPTMPVSIAMMAAMAEAFKEDHEGCSIGERGLACTFCRDFGHAETSCPGTKYGGSWRRWLAGPDTGLSSVTICRQLAGIPQNHPSAPLDPADFGRCHRLLYAIPGWRARIGEMRAVQDWAPLVDAWDELERLYLEELPTGKGPKLFARMQALRAEVRP